MARDTPKAGHSRRTVLSAVTAVGAATATGLAHASVPDGDAGAASGRGRAAGVQETGFTTPGLVPAYDAYEQANLAGWFLHVDPTTDPLDAPAEDDCGFADWDQENTVAYNVMLIDRKGDEAASYVSTLYVQTTRTIPAGGLYIINNMHQCDSNYIGIEIEQLARESAVFARGTDTGFDNEPIADEPDGETATSDGFGDGFGLLAALSGLVGAGALGQWLRDDESE